VTEKRFEWPKDPLDSLNARLDFEAEADRKGIHFSDRIARDCEKIFGGRVNAGYTRRTPTTR
jgi:hypothetical protein